MDRWLLRGGIAAALAGALVVVVLVVSGDGSSGRDRASSGRSTTTEPSPFPPLPDRDGARAVRTGTDLVLPVTGRDEGGWRVLTPCAATAVADGAPLTGAHVVLDPGHGGEEIGAVGPSGLTEADLNLDIAVRAARRLEAAGATVVMTRTSDVRVTLRTRTAIATALEPLAFVSIHHNAVPRRRSDAPGSEIYHQQGSDASKRLAGLLWEELREELGPFADEWAVGERPGALARLDVETGDDYYGVLRRSHGVPAVLSEAVFLSDPDEEALLLTDEFRDAEADAVADAVVRFVASDDPGSGFQPPRVVETPSSGGGGTAGCEDPPLG